jgi:hypothetical protein
VTHQCSAPGCEVQVPTHVFACRTHWRSLPETLRARLRATGRGGSLEELAAVRAECVAFLERKAAA